MAIKTVDKIFNLIQKYGKNNYIGEPVTIEEHMIQCAMLAEENGYSTKVSETIKNYSIEFLFLICGKLNT